MSRLDPNLKRLMTWARRAEQPEAAPAEAPFGFATRVVAGWKPAPPRSLWSELTQIARLTGAVALVVIVCGFVILVGQTRTPEPILTVTTPWLSSVL